MALKNRMSEEPVAVVRNPLGKRKIGPASQPMSLDVSRLQPQQILALQRATGNAAVATLLLQRDDAGVALKAPPTDAGVSVTTPVPTPADAGTAADPAKDAKDLLAEKLTTSVDYATWLLEARDKGFVKFTPGFGSEAQMEKLKKGEKVQGVDPKDATVIPALLTMYDVVKGPVTRWMAKPTDPKPVVMLGSFIRGSAPHTGAAIDINETNWTGKADQLITILGDLSVGCYGLGIPFQGDFLPPDRDLDTKEAEEAKKPEPATLTQMLKRGRRPSYTATWDKDKKTWNEVEDAGDDAGSSIKSAALKTKLAEMRKAGFTFMIFADNEGHFHLDRR